MQTHQNSQHDRNGTGYLGAKKERTSPCCSAKIVQLTADDYHCFKCGHSINDDPPLSECCQASPMGEIHNGFAHCAMCKEMAEFKCPPADTVQEPVMGIPATCQQGMEQHETPVFELGKDETGGPAFFWRNPWSNGKREKIASLWWPEHPESATDKMEWLFENLELRVRGPDREVIPTSEKTMLSWMD